MNALIVIVLMLFALGLIGRLTWNIEPRRNETPVDRQANEQLGQVMRMCSWMFWPGLAITSAGAVVALAQ